MTQATLRRDDQQMSITEQLEDVIQKKLFENF